MFPVTKAVDARLLMIGKISKMNSPICPMDMCLSTDGAVYSPSTTEQAIKERSPKTFLIFGISVGVLLFGVTVAMIIYILRKKGEVTLVNFDYEMS